MIRNMEKTDVQKSLERLGGNKPILHGIRKQIKEIQTYLRINYYKIGRRANTLESDKLKQRLSKLKKEVKK